MMKLNLLPGAIGEIIAHVGQTRQLTKADRYGLMAAIMTEAISEEERQAIDRLLRSVVRKRIQIGNEISAII
jgi:anthranilate phosphoribosyltransferase